MEERRSRTGLVPFPPFTGRTLESGRRIDVEASESTGTSFVGAEAGAY